MAQLHEKKIRTFAYHCCGFGSWASGAIVATYGAALKADLTSLKTKAPGWVADQVSAMQDAAWLVVPTGMIVIALLQWLRKRLGPPEVWTTIKEVLDHYREVAFPESSTDSVDHHRVTLFRHCDVCWTLGFIFTFKYFRGPWLKPVARSGHLSQTTDTIFRAPDCSDDAEGIAGLAFCRQKPIATPELVVPKNPTDSSVASYAAATGVSKAWVIKRLQQKKSTLAQSYGGIPVEIKGKQWGVIVLDSRKPGTVTQQQLDAYKPFGKVLVSLLKRV